MLHIIQSARADNTGKILISVTDVRNSQVILFIYIYELLLSKVFPDSGMFEDIRVKEKGIREAKSDIS